MGWPKGKPRKPRPFADEDRPVAINPVKVSRMKARPNWEDMDDDSDNDNVLHIDRGDFPDDMDLMWVTDSVYGRPEPQIRGNFTRKGWTPVHQSDFDGKFDGRWMKKGDDGEINHGGLVLMARPMRLTRKAQQEEYKEAVTRVAIKEAQIRGGDMPGVTLDSKHKSALGTNRINRSYEPIDVPEK